MRTMVHHVSDDGFFESTDGVRLYERCWPLSDVDKGCVVIVHGYGEHSGRYEAAATRLNTAGYAVYAFDLRNHGRSNGKRGVIRRFDDFVSDVDAFWELIHAQVADQPVFLWGHSMGGVVLARYANRRPPDVQGLVFSSPALKLGGDVSPFARRLIEILGTVLPRLPVIKVDSSALSRDSSVATAYEEDPYVHHGRIDAGTLLQMKGGGEEALLNLEEISVPVLVQHGTRDALTPVEGGKLLYQGVSSADRTLRLYEGAYHEVFNDEPKEAFYADLIAWLDARVGSGKLSGSS